MEDWMNSRRLKRLRKALGDELKLAERNGNDVMISRELAASLTKALDQAIHTEEGHGS